MKGQVWKVWTLFILNLSTWRGVPTRPANKNWNEDGFVNFFRLSNNKYSLHFPKTRVKRINFESNYVFMFSCFNTIFKIFHGFGFFICHEKWPSFCVPHFINKCFVYQKLWRFSLIFDEWTTHLIISLSREWHRHVQLPLEYSLLMRIQVMSKNQRRSFIFLIYFWSKKKEVHVGSSPSLSKTGLPSTLKAWAHHSAQKGSDHILPRPGLTSVTYDMYMRHLRLQWCVTEQNWFGKKHLPGSLF